MGAMSAPAFANTNSAQMSIELADKDPKKAKKAKKAEKSEAKKASGDCAKACEKTCDEKK